MKTKRILCAARIRAIEGCLGYDYFYPADDPEGVLLIDS